jgi:hypothetical protein
MKQNRKCPILEHEILLLSSEVKTLPFLQFQALFNRARAHELDLFLRAEPVETEPDRGVGQLGVDAKRGDDVGRLERRRAHDNVALPTLGLPIRESADQRLFNASPRLVARYLLYFLKIQFAVDDHLLPLISRLIGWLQYLHFRLSFHYGCEQHLPP